MCKDTFPEEATIECIEDRLPGIDLKIMATPCDGIRECRDGRDEECEDDKLILIFVISGLVATTLLPTSVLNMDKDSSMEEKCHERIQSRY